MRQTNEFLTVLSLFLMVLRLLAVRRPQNRVRHVKKQVGRQSLMHFGAKNDGFMINLRFDLGEKSRGVVKPLFSPMPKGDILTLRPYSPIITDGAENSN